MPVVDASLLTASVILEDAHHGRAVRWLRVHLASDMRPLVAPTIVLSEVAGAARRALPVVADAEAAIERISRSVAIELATVDDVLARSAAQLALGFRLKGCDAIYVALAAARGETLVTFDREQAQRAASVVKVVIPA